jgi:hypothetical protein
MDNFKTTITAHGHCLNTGYVISMNLPDRRWWRLLLWRLLRRSGQPQRRVSMRVAEVAGATVTVEPRRRH